MKIVINRCYGGFSLSRKAYVLWCEKEGIIPQDTYGYDITRNNKSLVEVVEELGEDAGGTYSDLRTVEIPDDVDWIIQEYDGIEWVAEKHRTWEE